MIIKGKVGLLVIAEGELVVALPLELVKTSSEVALFVEGVKREKDGVAKVSYPVYKGAPAKVIELSQEWEEKLKEGWVEEPTLVVRATPKPLLQRLLWALLVRVQESLSKLRVNLWAFKNKIRARL